MGRINAELQQEQPNEKALHGLHLPSITLLCFLVALTAGEDKAYQMAEVNHLVTGKDAKGRPQEDRSVLVLTSPLVENPIHYRYAWARNPMGNIQLGRYHDVPLATQRSDSWELTEGPISTDGMNDRQAISAMRQAMREADLQRRLHEAKELIQSQE